MRKYTNQLIEMMKSGIIDPEHLARECLQYMSESDVEDMARSTYLLVTEEDLND
jgi:hypothetical protein